MSTITCPFCLSTSCNEISSENNQYDCPSCGKYQLDCSAEEVKSLSNINTDKLCDFAGYLFETNRLSETFKSIKLIKDTKERYSFEDEVIDSKLVPKTISQKMNKLLINLYKLFSDPVKCCFYQSNKGITFVNKYITQYEIDNDYHIEYPLCYAPDFDELSQDLMLCHEEKYLYFFQQDEKKVDDMILGTEPFILQFRLSSSGVFHTESLIFANDESNQIFIAMKFNYPESKKLRKSFINCVKVACLKGSNGKFEAIILPDKEYNGGISDRIKYEIKRSKAVIVDYTYDNQNVYFEAGFADALGLPIIRCCDQKWADKVGGLEKAIRFDERHNNLITWKSYKELQQKIEDRIRNVLM
ncbi:MAG: hypothetical protein LBM93_07565 [Oscillospiraceae bacterium]|jgi:hypothetical protein|nr:hypothetical protein [Oscillospiraceae bacterium]